MRLHECVACGARSLEPVLDLGVQPLANSYQRGCRSTPQYKLAVNHCLVCTHSQLAETVPPDEMFLDYAYVSGTSTTLRTYMSDFAKAICDRHHPSNVLDIACNDGTLMDAFRELGCNVYGVDPARNLRHITRSKGLEVTQDFWSVEVANSLARQFDLIVAMNVLGHCDDPLSFLLACKAALTPEGRITIQTSQAAWLENGEFDCVYHEHVSYFTEKSLAHLASRAGLVVAEFERVAIHGGSLLATFMRPHCLLQARAEQTSRQLRQLVCSLQADGWRIVGYGAAAKGNTLLNFVNLPLEFIVDDNSLKWGMYTPGQNIEIRNPDAIAIPNRCAVLLLAWNFKEEIKKKVQAIRLNQETVFIVPFPEVRTEK